MNTNSNSSTSGGQIKKKSNKDLALKDNTIAHLARLKDIIDKVREWASHQREMIPLGGQHPLVDLIYEFLNSLKPLNMTNRAGTIAATCIYLFRCIDSSIKVEIQQLADYFHIPKEGLSDPISNLSQRLDDPFFDFAQAKACTLVFGVHRLIFLTETPLDRIIAATRHIVKIDEAKLMVVDKNGEPIHQLRNNTEYFLAKRKVSKKEVK